MKSREMTILVIAIGMWMTWRVIGSSLIPIGSQEVGIAVIVLFKPWLDFRGWVILLTMNATSYLPVYYRAWMMFMTPFMEVVPKWLVDTDMVSGEFVSVALSMGWSIGTCLIISFIYTFFIWPYIWERVYRKAGVWGRLNG